MCRDFAVLEDHSLAYNLQEQEIESHLASNVHKSRLVQQDLQVAKRLQEEEDERAKARSKKQQSVIERHDNEIAQEIQEELARQAEQQRQQEEKDAAIARKLQEKEMKEERKRQKQLETNFDEEYFEDQGAAGKPMPLDLDRPTHYRTNSPSRHEAYAPGSSYRDYSPDYSSTEPKRSRHPKRDPAAPHSLSRYPEHSLGTEGSRSRHADPYPENLLSPRGKHGDRYPDYVATETSHSRTLDDGERGVRKKERPARPPPPQSSRERDKAWDRDREPNWERHMDRDQEQDLARTKDRQRDRGRSADPLRERDQHRHKDQQRVRTQSRDRELSSGRTRGASWEEEEQERRARGRPRVKSNSDDVFEEHMSDRGSGEPRDPRQWDGPGRERGYAPPNGETGRLVHKGSGSVLTETDYRLNEATKGLTKLDIHDLEHRDREVARRLQEEEIKATNVQTRAAQVAQDEEIARLLMEQEKKEYKKLREREKERQREKEKEREREKLALERLAMERKWQEADYRPSSEEVVRPRTRDDYEYQRQKNHNKPARPPQPRPHDYVNVTPAYSHPEHPAPPQAPTRPEAVSRGPYYKR